MTIQRLNQILTALFKKECSNLDTSDITIPQLLYVSYLASNGDASCLDDKRYNRKNFYYTLKKLQSTGYITVTSAGRYIQKIELTPKGKQVQELLDKIFEKQIKQLLFKGMEVKELSHVLTLVYRFERFWIKLIEQKQSVEGIDT